MEADLVGELRRSKRRLRAALDNGADLVVLIGSNGELLATSDGASRQLGYDDDRGANRSVLEFIHPDDLPMVRDALAEALRVPGPIHPLSFRVQHADGTWREMEGSGTNLLDDADVAAVIVGLHDVTERRRLERTFLRLHRLNSVLAEANEAVLRATDPIHLLRDACRIAVEQGGLETAVANVREGDDLVPRTSFGVDWQTLTALRRDYASPAPRTGRIAEARETGRVVTVHDIAEEPEAEGWRDVALAMGLRSSAHLPLVVEGEVSCVLSVYADQVGFFDVAATSLLERLAGNVAHGLATLEHARARAEADAALLRRTRQQGAVARLGQFALQADEPEEVAASLASALVSGVDADLVSVLELQPGGERFRVIAGAGLPRGVVGWNFTTEEAAQAAWVVSHRAPIVVDDYATEERFPSGKGLRETGAVSGMSAPVDVDGRAWGVIAVHSRKPRKFDGDDVSFLQSMANVLAATIGRHEAFSRLRHQALHDPLTGLPNRILLEDRLSQAAERHRRGGAAVSVAVLDVDGFRLVNDTLGPAAGDDLLRAVAQRLAYVVRPGDTLARLAADEFAVVREQPDDLDVAELIRGALAEPVEVAGRPLMVTVGLGTAEADDTTLSGPELLQRAMSALHIAKVEGRGRHRRHDSELEAQLSDRFDLQADLAHALSRAELELWWQPIVATASGAVVAAESLLRWRHPDRGLVPPCDFIGIAEETGQIVPIGAWVIAEACRTIAPWTRWAAATGRDFHVSVNLSAVQLADPGLVDHVAACLRANDLQPSSLRLEITESVLFSERDSSSSVLGRLHDLGVGLVVDDFGTGFSSLSYLQRFPLQSLKVDQSFTSTLEGNEHTTAIVAAIVGMARALGLETVAEGVEEESQRAELLRLGCTFSQGWLFGRPEPAACFERVLRASAPSPHRRPSAPSRTTTADRALLDEPSGRSAVARFDEGAFRSLVEDARDCVSCFDRDLRHVYVNPAVEQLAGLSRAEMLGRTCAELGMKRETAREWEAALRTVFVTGRPMDFEIALDSSMGLRWLAARMVPDLVDGMVATVSAFTRDVTEYHLASAITDASLDPVTGLLGRSAFVSVVIGVRHGTTGAFGVVRMRFGAEPPTAEVGALVRSLLRAGDVAGRWATDEIVALCHPIVDGELESLAERLGQALRPFGAPSVLAVRSEDGGESALSLVRAGEFGC